MSSVVGLVRSRTLPRVLAVAVMAAAAAACSSEVARFDSNPYASSRNDTTASIQQQPQQAPSGQVQTSSLPPPSGIQPAAMPATGVQTTGVSGGGRGMASYHPDLPPEPVTTGSVQQRPPAQSPQQSPHALPPPVRQTKAPASKIGPTQPVVHVVAPGETLIRIARKYDMPLAELARVNNIPPHTKVNIGDRINVPARNASRVAAKPDTQKAAKALSAPPKAKVEAKAKVESKTLPKSQPKATPQLASHQPTETANVATNPVSEPPAGNPVRAGNAGLSFRWPAKGRIIAGFGPKTNGQTNDGINIALPEGTPIKAAEDGVVAYAGNELKGYGNLVLVRHADGYVTAYAHAKELLVKRGDPIKRGQTIARSGQSGNVDAPQLHFEIRKGPSPIDPMPHLSGG
jgi:murein DD-endopeptidase MepM/ murein hydrolase activator NlpD